MGDILAINLLLGLPRELRNQILEYVLPVETADMLSMRYVDGYHIQSKKDIEYYYHECGCEFHHWDPCWDLRRPCPLSVLWVNRQLHAEALDVLYSKPVDLYFHGGMFFGGYACQMAGAAENGDSYVFPSFSKHFHSSNVKQVHIQVEPSNFPGFWHCIRSALTTLCNDELTHPLVSVTVDLLDMEQGSWLGMGDDHIEDVYDPIMARLDDYVATLDIFENLLRLAAKCTVRLPYWAESQKGIGAVLHKYHQILGVKIEFMPLTRPRHVYVDNGPRTGLAEVWED